MKTSLKRPLMISLCIPIVVVGWMFLSFLLTQTYLTWKSFPVSTEAPHWPALASEDIPSIATLDDDGSRRITQLWIAVVANTAYIRTGETKWFANLRRDPSLELRIGGLTYPCRTQLITDPAEIQLVHKTFRAKYPKRSKFFRSIGVSTNTIIALDCAGRG